MRTLEFTCRTDMITGTVFYFTKENGLYVSGSGSLKKDEAYDIFIKLCGNEPTEIIEIIETKTFPD